MRDCLDPEFALVGTMDEKSGRKLRAFYQTITEAPVVVTSLENAELIKTSYNGYIGLKIGFALVIGMALVATFNDIKLILRQFAL